MKSILARCLSLFLGAGTVLAADDVIINEIMYNTPSANPDEEWIELHNRGTNAVSLNGWRFSNGIEFTFSNVTILPGSHLVVAADVTTFSDRYPSVSNVVGGWIGTLSNNGEDIDLDDAAGERADSVNYATDGDWGTRRRGPFLAGTRGWEWFADHDGIGKSLELRNAALSNNHGQNWGSSIPVGGTPGAANSLAATNIAPLIVEGVHSPVVPLSSQAVTISAQILDEQTNGLSVFVWHRTFSNPFATTQMFDDGLHNDGAAGDGIFAATLPAQFNETVVEFYLSATDASFNSRTWPAPALNESGAPVQEANAQYQVDDSVYAGTQPIYRVIMTEVERQTLEFINRQSDAQMNCTFITIDAISTEVRYLCGIRIRGAGSRGRTPPNFRLNLPNDKLWKDVDEINLNSQYTHAQLVGSAVAERAGLPVAHARVVQMRVNARNLANAGSPQFGSYVAVEVLNGDWADEHVPTDPEGNMYRGSTGNHTADLSYQGTSPANYTSRGYSKTSNTSENDWSDLINLTFVLNNTPDSNYTAAVSQVANVREWMKYFAVHVLMEYSETALGTGEGDDFSMYRGIVDPRFLLLAHDFDTIFGQGDTQGNINESIFIAADTSDQPAVARFLTWRDFVPIYYDELNRMLNGAFSEQELFPLFDRFLTGLVPQATIDAMKTFATARNNFVRSQVRLSLTVNAPALPVVNGLPRATNSTVALSGFGNVIETRSIRVGGALANWAPVGGSWNISAVNLNPGINRILVQSFDANGTEFARTNVDVWYDRGSFTTLPSAILSNATLTAAGGPYRVSSSVTVPSGVTLTIEPGTTIYFEQGNSFNVNGRLIAEGTETQRIRLTQAPGSGETWGGIRFNNSTQDNRIAYVDFAYASTADPIVAVNSTLLVDNVTWSFTTRTIIDLNNSSLICRNSVFPTIVNNEVIHGTGMPPNGYVIIERNYFGGTTGYSDIIDFTGGQRPGPILQVLDNIFDGGSDDALDLDSTDAHIEGNVFRRIHQDAPRDSASFAIATDFGSEITVVRNVFYDNDHAVLLKNGAFLTAQNNTIVGSTIAAIAFDETNRVVNPGLGASLDGNILWNNAALFEHLYYNDPFETNTDLTVNRSIMQGTNQPGIGNLNLDPLFVNPAMGGTNDFHLQAGSPAIRTGPNGLDMGAYVPKGASVSGEPHSPTPLTSATLTVGGPGITHYRYRLNDGPYSAEISVTNNPIVLSGLSNGTYVVYVVGKNSAGVWQDFTNATVSRTWEVNSALSLLRINEVLARNVAALVVGGENPDLVEIYNGGTAMVDLSGMGLSDDLAEPFKFVFPPGTVINAGQYRILFADNESGPGLHLGFALDQTGDELYLHNANGSLRDSVVFGPQVADVSIGRLADGSWGLTRPTFGGVNVPQPAGDPHVLKINEWLAHGVTLYQDDFVELYNPLPAPVNLSGSYLTDAPQGSPARHQMPPLSFVAPNGFLLLIASGEPTNGRTHLNFKLSPNQGEIGLFAPDLSLIDCIVYGPQATDIAEGRIPNGSSTIGFINPPTPGGPNPAFTSTTVISNIVLNIFGVTNRAWRYEASGTICDNSWLQPGFDDSGWSNGFGLFGFETTPAVYPFPFNTFIAPNQAGGPVTAYFRTRFVWTNGPGWQLVATNYLDDGAAFYLNGLEAAPRVRLPTGANCFTFANNQTSEGQGEIVNLGSPANGTNILQVELHQAFDSSDDVFGMALSAVRTVTNIVFQNVVLNEVMANNLSITNAGSTNITDWVELYNPSSSTINLTGMSLSDDIALPRRWVFPPGTTISAGAYRIVRFDSASPATTNTGGGMLNTGFGLRAGGDEVYLFDTLARGGGLINSIVFGLQAADFSIGRIPNGAGPWELNLPTPGAVNIIASLGTPTTLTINEWLANPSGNDEDFIELYNPNPQPVRLSGLFLTDNTSAATRNQHKIAPLSFIGVGSEGFALFIADSDNQGRADHVNFGLRAQGEEIGLFAPSSTDPNAAGMEIDSIDFRTRPQLNGVSEGRFPDGSTNIVRFPGTTTPGRSNIRALTDIVVSEVLTHTDDPLEDAIELQNVSAAAIDISGWYLSDARNDPKKYRIPEGTVIQPGGFVVFYEYQFNANPFPNIYPSFSLSSVEGDDVFLSTANAAGALTGFRSGAEFGAAENGVSFGRYQTSVDVDFTALSQRTFGVDNPATLSDFRMGTGLSNAYPKVGPIIINEIMYHPPDIGTNDNEIDEFIELRNISGAAVSLFHANYPTNTWRLRDAVDFDFPANVTLAADSFLLVVSFNPNTNAAALAAFQARYSVPTNVLILGPYDGRLANDGENVELYKPDAPVAAGPDTGFVPYIQADKVRYSDAAPWPIAADGNTNGIGVSLQRRAGPDYGNDPVNWLAGNPSAGAANGPAIAALPMITQQPQSQTVPAGTSVTFSVAATGAGPLRYQWRFNGSNIPGATNTSFTVVSAQLVNSGHYTVLVNNPVGAVLSMTAVLTVQAPPVITQQPQSRAVVRGGTAIFSVTAQGTAPLGYQWRKEGTNLPGAINATLVITNVQPENEGNYTVVVTNPFGSLTSQVAQLGISAIPVIVVGPQSTNVFVGATVTFSVVANGSPPLLYQWRFNNVNIPGQTNASLVLTNAQVTDSGNYAVFVTNTVGGVLSANATLIVTVPPVLSVIASDAVAGEQNTNTGTFAIRRTGSTSLSLTVEFSVSGSAIPDSDYQRLPNFVVIPPGSAQTSLTVTPIDEAVLEGDETVIITLTNTSAYVVGSPASATVTIFDNDNIAPSVTLTNPLPGAVFVPPASINLAATASDSDGSVARVEFYYNGTNKIGEAVSAPYVFTWTNAPSGNLVLTAVAVDNLGSTGVSAPVTINVNSAPIVAITNPPEGAIFTAPANIAIAATATDLEGTVTNVEFYAGTNLIGASSVPTAGPLRADYRFQNSLASSIGSAPALTNIGANSFISTTIDGTNRTVLRFAQNNGVALGQASNVIPNNVYTVVLLFSFDIVNSWRRIIDFKNATFDTGVYSLNGGLQFYPDTAAGPSSSIPSNTFVQVVLTRDSARNVVGYVDGVEQFSFVDTADNGALTAANVLRLFRDDGTEASAGSIARLRLYDVAFSAAQVAALDRLPGSAPVAMFYSINWNSVPAGSYILTARAADNHGSVGISPPINITVNAPPLGFADMFANRGLIGGYTNSITGNNGAYTTEPAEPRHDLQVISPNHRSAWITWTAPGAGICTIDTIGSSFDTVLAVYTNSPPSLQTVSNLVRVASNDDDGANLYSRLTFNAIGGVAYHIVVDGYASGVGGSIIMHLNLPNQSPVITTQPQNQIVNQGATATFNVVAIGQGILRYQWFFNGTNINGATNATLMISNARSTNDGTYTVTVSNPGGSITSVAATLTVRLPPSIVGHPQSQVVNPGSNTTFTVTANGTAPFSYQWRFNGANIAGATSDSFTRNNVQHTNAGLYSVTVANAAGSAISQGAELIVRPQIMSAQRMTNGVLQLLYHGTPGRNYAIEWSGTLTNWSTLISISNSAVAAQYQDTNTPSLGNRSYRIRLLP